MDNKIVLSIAEEEFLNSMFKESEFVCVNCLSSADVDEDQTYTYCEICEAFTEVKKKGKA